MLCGLCCVWCLHALNMKLVWFIDSPLYTHKKREDAPSICGFTPTPLKTLQYKSTHTNTTENAAVQANCKHVPWPYSRASGVCEAALPWVAIAGRLPQRHSTHSVAHAVIIPACAMHTHHFSIVGTASHPHTIPLLPALHRILTMQDP